MKFKYPLFGALAILFTVLLSQLLLWPCHRAMVESRGGPSPVWTFAPLKDGERFPRSTHNLYPVEPISIETPELDPTWRQRVRRAQELVVRSAAQPEQGKSP